ncbi:CBO0543 family protein [Paenibacillus mucilaginosus]|nr:CBO0543 family protein [Paenibacillus mucilaginosus]
MMILRFESLIERRKTNFFEFGYYIVITVFLGAEQFLMMALGITVIILIAIIVAMPKKLSLIEYYCTSLFAFLLNATSDFSLNLQFKLYGYFQPGVDIGGYVIVYIIGPCISTLFLNYFPVNRSVLIKLFYIIAWSLFSILYEIFIALPSGMIYYNGWKWWYSGLLYPVLFLILVADWKLVRNMLKHHLRSKKGLLSDSSSGE